MLSWLWRWHHACGPAARAVVFDTVLVLLVQSYCNVECSAAVTVPLTHVTCCLADLTLPGACAATAIRSVRSSTNPYLNTTVEDGYKYVYASDNVYSMKWGSLNTAALVLGSLAVLTAAFAGWKRPGFWDDSADADSNDNQPQVDPQAARAVSELELLQSFYSSLTAKNTQPPRRA
jgi:hypothetical protein